MSQARENASISRHFADQTAAYAERVAACLDAVLPGIDETPRRLHEAMRYAVLSSGKRIRPLLVYATGECLGVKPDKLDAPATAIELIHAFSLVHDDLPAMDNDDLRRGQPTVHRKFDEATAILAADALQPLAFRVIASSPALQDSEKTAIITAVAEACGSLGMTGGQSIDLASEGQMLSADALAEMYYLKTGALIRACVMSVTCLAPNLSATDTAALDSFARDIGLAFQIRDDILDVAGETEVIGKRAGADEKMSKATWPALFGLDESRRRCDALLDAGTRHLKIFGKDAEPLRSLAVYIVERAF
jgi:farnesyl diphosphate synthase